MSAGAIGASPATYSLYPSSGMGISGGNTSFFSYPALSSPVGSANSGSQGDSLSRANSEGGTADLMPAPPLQSSTSDQTSTDDIDALKASNQSELIVAMACGGGALIAAIGLPVTAELLQTRQKLHLKEYLEASREKRTTPQVTSQAVLKVLEGYAKVETQSAPKSDSDRGEVLHHLYRLTGAELQKNNDATVEGRAKKQAAFEWVRTQGIRFFGNDSTIKKLDEAKKISSSQLPKSFFENKEDKSFWEMVDSANLTSLADKGSVGASLNEAPPEAVKYPKDASALNAVYDANKGKNLFQKTMRVDEVREKFYFSSLATGKKPNGSQWVDEMGEPLKDSDEVQVLVSLEAPEKEDTKNPTLPQERLLAIWHPSNDMKGMKPPQSRKRRAIENTLYPQLQKRGKVIRFIKGVGQRYADYYHGAQETFGNPKGMGKVFPNLISTSLGISTVFYGSLYLVQYEANLRNLDHQAALKQGKAQAGQANQSSAS